MHRSRSTEIYRKVLIHSRECWGSLAAVFALNLAATPLTMLLPVPLKIAVDSVLGDRPFPRVLQAIVPATALDSWQGRLLITGGLLLFISVLLNVQSLASWLLQTYTGEKLVLDLRAKLFWHVQRLSLGFYERRGAKDTAYRIEHDAPAIQYIVIQGMMPFLAAMLSFAAMLMVTLRMSRPLAGVAVLLSIPLFLLARSSNHRTRDGWNEVKELDSQAMLIMHEALVGARAVQAYGRERHERNRFLSHARQRMWRQIRLSGLQARFHVGMSLTIAVGSTAALAIGTWQVRIGGLSIGDLLLVMAYMAQLYEPLRVISSKISEMSSWTVSMERALALLDEASDVPQSANAKPVESASGDVTFRNVSFGYNEGQTALNNVSFTVKAGTRVAIVGPSGSGKSTLVNLLTRFYDPREGVVELDGRDLRSYRLSDLRHQFAVVLQEPFLFSTSISENIAYADANATPADIQAAAQAANAHDFIQRLPQGYETRIGERGAKLSGGEKQRLALARAFLKKAPVLILDEPTSAVDIKTEAAIMNATESLMHGRTTFIIAHRLSTIRDCDVLFALRNGELTIASPADAEALLMQDPDVQHAGRAMVAATI